MTKPALIALSLLCLACLAGIAMVARDFALNAGQSPEEAWKLAGTVFGVLLGLAGLLFLRALARILIARAGDRNPSAPPGRLGGNPFPPHPSDSDPNRNRKA